MENERGSGQEQRPARSREAILDLAAYWLRRNVHNREHIWHILRELYDLASRPPTPPATPCRTRRAFAAMRQRHFEYQIGNSETADGHAEADARAADALLAAAGLAWKAEASEPGPEVARLSREFDAEAIRRATAAEVKAGVWGEATEAAGSPEETDFAAAFRHTQDRRRHEAREAVFAEARRQEADAALGAKMQELLGSKGTLGGFVAAMQGRGPDETRAEAAVAWLREQVGMDKAEQEPLPEQIGWAIDSWVSDSGREILRPTLIGGGEQADKVYAEAVRRYNAWGKVDAWAERRLQNLTTMQDELLAILAEGRP